ncbi:MAG: spermidine/putrescine ABC transporter substrate-binding protein, partial [Anaerolineae bacterium]|nr:spermidine/putrescine ABC transporter substrate-binding protein [Anaerolineae bacterium]
MSMHRLARLLFLAALLAGCSSAPGTPTLADELTIYNYGDYIPKAVLDAFTEEYGVKIDYQIYVSPDEAAASVLDGSAYDVVLISSAQVPRLLQANALAKIDHQNIPNMVGLSANFRDLAYDPQNEHSVPYYWGATGLVYRTDLFQKPVTGWDALWETRYGKVGLWQEQRFVLGLGLQSLGYSANTEKPEEIEAALDHLMEMKHNAIFMETLNADTSTAAYALADGLVPMSLGWAYDALLGRDLNAAIQYVTPREGTMLWVENILILARSEKKYTAEVFINFLLRPENAAQYANEFYYAVTSEPAREFINPDILSNQAIYPTNEMLTRAEFILPLTAEGQALYD